MPPVPFSDFVTTLLDILSPLGDVDARRMFGGVSIRCNGLTFALIADDVLYFKADTINRPAFVALDLEPFKPFPNKKTVMSYYPPPETALDDAENLLLWAREALSAARRADIAKPPKRKPKPPL